MNKVVRTLGKPITASRVRLQMVQGEQDAYTTRIYEFAVYGYLKSEDPVGIDDVSDEDDEAEEGYYSISGWRTDTPRWNGIYLHGGRKVLK